LPPAITEEEIMEGNIDAAIGGSDRRRMSGDAAVIKAGAEGVASPGTGEAPRALARAQACAAAR
jgi:hypothetical protein